MDEFLKIVQKGLKECQIEQNQTLGVAVSGGADSICLLVSLFEICGNEKIKAITINHNIRPIEETGKDADYVENLCKNLNIFCKRVDFERGLVEKTANERKGGTEEAARFLRYKAFEDFAKENALFAICTAHNKNDFLETILMRFLQGSSSFGGIPARRGIFCRPLLFAAREQIEDFLKSRKIEWRTDKTNFDEAFLRNRIRSKLIPFLNEEFSGWQNAAIFGAEKGLWQNQAISEIAEKKASQIEQNENSARISRIEFDGLSKAAKLSILHSLIGKAGFFGRFPYKILREFCILEKKKSKSAEFSGFSIKADSEFVEISKILQKSDCGFCALIEKKCAFLCGKIFFEFDGGILKANGIAVLKINAPFLIRSNQSADFEENSRKEKKSVSKILAEWKTAEKKSEIPIVQSLPSQKIAAILGSPLGFPNWICEEFKLP